MSHSNSAERFPKRVGEPRQLFFLALCSLALVLAAFAAPPTAQGAAPPDIPMPSLFGNGSEGSSDCVVTLSETPVPGRSVTVTVYQADQPVDGVRVWFNDRAVGVTNRSGQVEGRVPYVRKLEIRVNLAGGGSCEFVTGTARRTESRPRAAVDARSHPRAAVDARSHPRAAVDAGTDRALLAGAGDNYRPAAQAGEDANVTGTYVVPGTMDIRVEGEPNPGENVTLVATIENEPVPDARVSVDGDVVGRTDERGRHAIRIPTDRTSRLTVVVERGEFRSRHRIDVRLLEVGIDGDERFPLPGQSATVQATIGTDAVEGATVSLDGEPIGTTDAAGRTAFVLPADPMATVTVSSGDRTVETPIIVVFAPTIAAAAGAFLLLVGGPLTIYWADGRRGLAGLGVLGALLVAGVFGHVYAGRVGAVGAVGAALLLVSIAMLYRRPDAPSAVGDSAGRLLASVIDRVTNGVLWTTRQLETFIDQTRATLVSAIDRLRSYDLASMATGVRASLVAVPTHVRTVIGFVLGVPGRVVRWLRSEPTPEESSHDREPQRNSTAATTGPAIRELWRRFARSVVRDRWPQRTPGEVSRRAIDDGFPRESVAELTSVFRDVEYGGESLSTERYERARTAFETLGVDQGDPDSVHEDSGNVDGDGGDGTPTRGTDSANPSSREEVSDS